MPGEKIREFRDLIVWQKAHALVLKIYKMTKTFPAEERYGLVSQMRRAAVSVAANIAEGFKRRGPKNKALFYNMSQTSLEELRYYLILSRDLGYCQEVEGLMKDCSEVARLLIGLIKSVQSLSSP